MPLKSTRIKPSAVVTHVAMIIVGLFTLYPIIWLFFASLKPNEEIFASVNLLPTKFMWSSYVDGWKGAGRVTYMTFYKNTFLLVMPTVLFTVLSCSFVAYGFARFKFRFKKILFYIMISTLMLPNAVILIPRYMLFRNFGWLNTYLPFIVPAIFACFPFFIYMMIQFFRGIPRDMDEAAHIDGCNTFHIYWRIIMPLCKPALFSAAIFQFIWTWNDFFPSLIYINSVNKFPVVLALRMSLDVTSVSSWNNILAMSMLSLIPGIVLFFSVQNYFVEGVTSGSIKG